MQTVRTIGLDIAKSVFQIHGVDATGNVIVRRKPKRRYVLPFFQKLPPCLVGIEACASSLFDSASQTRYCGCIPQSLRWRVLYPRSGAAQAADLGSYAACKIACTFCQGSGARV